MLLVCCGALVLNDAGEVHDVGSAEGSLNLLREGLGAASTPGLADGSRQTYRCDMSSPEPSDREGEWQEATKGRPRYNPKSKQAAEAEDKKFSEMLTSWPVAAAISIVFWLDLPRVLRSDFPWSAIVYPGFFIALGAWPIFTHFARRRLPERSLILSLPLPIFMVLGTGTMFVFFVATDEAFYRRQALGSLIFTIPLGALAIVHIFASRIARRGQPHGEGPAAN